MALELFKKLAFLKGSVYCCKLRASANAVKAPSWPYGCTLSPFQEYSKQLCVNWTLPIKNTPSPLLVSPDDVLVLLVFAPAVLPPPVHHRRIHVCWTWGVWFVQQTHLRRINMKICTFRTDPSTAYHWKEYCAHVLRRVPPFTGQLSRLGVVHRGVKDGHTQIAILRVQRLRRIAEELDNHLIDIWVPDFWKKSNGGWVVWVVGGELEMCL